MVRTFGAISQLDNKKLRYILSTNNLNNALNPFYSNTDIVDLKTGFNRIFIDYQCTQ